MKKITLIALILFSFQKGNSQCTINASASSTTIRCGQPVNLSAFGQSTGTVILNENFNSGGFGPGWSSTPGAVNFSNPCSPGGVDGTPHAWMDNNTTEPRTLTSTAYNLSTATAGVTICFDLLYAIQGNAAPCEGPDEPDEGVYLRYSTNGGATWVTIHYFDPNGGNDPTLTNWNNYCFVIPAAAITSNTMFSWYQDVGSGADYDHWGIDNVEIYQNDVNSNLVWLHDGYSYGVGNPGGVDPTPVTPTATTTYTAQLTTGSGVVCTQSVTVTVLPPDFDVNITATPNPICLGSCANITATAVEVISPASTPTFENNEIGAVTSGHASVNINVQGLNTTSLSSGSITQVVINGFNFSGTSFCSSFGGCPCGTGTVSFGQTCTLTPSSFTVTLTGPGGCTIILAPAGAATGNYSNTVFVPVGGTAIGGGFPTGGPWNPSQPFSNLNGCDPNGVWTLTFNAPGVGFGFGTLTGWSISFNDPAITAPVTYSWSPTTNMTNSTTLTPTVCPTATTTYNLTVANSTPGCATYTEGVTVTVNNCTTCIPPTVTITPPAAICAPGTVNLTSAVSGIGTSIVTYHATNADATAGVSPLASTTVSTSGTYFVRVQDPSNATCFSVQSITVTINPAVTVSVTPSSATVCPGGSASLTASGAATYSWAPATGLSATTGAAVTATPATTTTYTVTGTSSGCTGTATVTVTVATPPVVSVTPASPTICPGGNVSLTASGASSYAWASATGLSGTTGATVTASPAATTTYTVTGTTGTCTATTTVTVTVSSSLVLSVTPANPTICPGASTSLTASGATTYAWAASTGLSATSGATVTASPATTTTYTVTGTSGTCTATTTVTVNVSSSLIVSVTPSSATICPGGNVSLTASGASAYTWASATGLSGTSGATVTASPATTTTYTVTGTSGTCTADTTVTITVSPGLTVSVTPSSATICPGGSVSLTASGASAYTWASAAGLSGTSGATVTASPATTTTYTVTGTSGTCTADTTVTVTVSSSLLVSVTPSSATICPGGSVSLTAGGAASYTWASATGLSSTSGATVTASPVTTTTYTVTGTSGTCTADTTVTITVASSLIVSVTPSSATICPGASVSLTASGASSYTWASASGPSGTTATVTASPLTTTTYTVTGTSGTCTADTTVTVTVSPTFTVNVTPSNPTICPGGSVSLTASGGTTYAWAAATGLSGTSGATVTASPATTTTYTVTGTTGTCTADTTVTVTVSPVLVISVTPSSPTICPGDSISLTAGGASTYAWASATGLSGTTGATVHASPAVTTTYTVTGTSGTCTADTTVTITVAPHLTVSVTPASPTICAGSSVSLTANGATTYSWASAAGLSSTSGPTVTASPAATTTYTVTGTSGTCTADTTVTVTVIQLPVLVTNASPPGICAGSSSVLTANGATTYLWSPSSTLSSSTDSVVTATPATTTVYTVIGSNGACNSNANVTVTVTPVAVADAGINDTICLGQSAGLLASGGNTYVWTPPAGLNNPNIPNPVAAPAVTTTYTVDVSNGGICGTTDIVTVYVNPLPVVSAGPDAIINVGESVTLLGAGDSLTWTDFSATLDCYHCATPTASPMTDAIYIITAVDTNGCVNRDTAFVQVTQESALYIPNAFSPNGDGMNAVFMAKGYGIKELRMMIFDRWGEKIFDTSKLGEGWDGTYKGNVVQQDVYSYVILATPYVGNKIKRIGSVTVVR